MGVAAVDIDTITIHTGKTADTVTVVNLIEAFVTGTALADLPTHTFVTVGTRRPANPSVTDFIGIAIRIAGTTNTEPTTSACGRARGLGAVVAIGAGNRIVDTSLGAGTNICGAVFYVIGGAEKTALVLGCEDADHHQVRAILVGDGIGRIRAVGNTRSLRGTGHIPGAGTEGVVEAIFVIDTPTLVEDAQIIPIAQLGGIAADQSATVVCTQAGISTLVSVAFLVSSATGH